MPYTIGAHPDQLESSASRIEQYADDIAREVQGVKTLIDELRGTFLGVRATAFFGMYQDNEQAMQRWDDVVRAFAAEMREAAVRLRTADEAASLV